MGESSGRKRIQIDVVSDTVCPWCFVGRRTSTRRWSNLRTDLTLRWHPFLLSPSAPKEGIKKSEFYRQKFGNQSESINSRMKQVFQSLGYEYDLSGLWGSTLDSHRLIDFAGKQGFQKQHDLVEELFLNYFTQGKYIGDRQVLLEAAEKVGVEGAAEFLEDPSQGLNEVKEELGRYAERVNGVPHYLINGKEEFSGGRPPEAFCGLLKLLPSERAHRLEK
ncbi:unnamed protein product [Spirodela intermedia]|uniref:DSBA-like thioredoxin domain-containing protein n=1 Tax=Spirodela intermedia TaxID=51605 RepID=A0A7I8IHS0_SPIIN|nr:unnamed protein product [Spirodela intermedia]CAA6657334.1 unnamed protein product [Spirodela intermedia]